jgi:S1-C subfamily serine protease
MNLIDRAAPAVVALRSSIPDDAFTADILGTVREGAGVVIGRDGLVLTIGYLITEAESVWLTTRDGRSVPAHALAYDQETGFGLVQALASLDVPPVALGSSAASKVGDAVAMVSGAGQPVLAKIVAKQEFAGYWEYLLDEALFTSPAHPFWGGAALIGSEGQLLGIGSLRLEVSKGREVEAINMAVPIDLLKPILSDLKSRGQLTKPPRPWLGAYAAENNGKVIVMNVAERAPAAQAGLQPGDVISEVRNEEVQGLADFYRKVWGSGPPGTELPVRIVRGGRETWLRIKSADRNSFLKKPLLQ